MLLIPAIDIKDGHCVRLRQGRMDDSTTYSENPLSIAGRWVSAGARRLHLVDLDGALAGFSKNEGIIENIIRTYPDLPIQVGGGIRDQDTVQRYLDMGVQYAILGTKAVSTPHFINNLCMEFPGHVMVGLDAKNGKVAIDGWSKLSNYDVVDLAKRFEDDGVVAIIYTDINRDGMLAGPNIEATVHLAQSVQIPIIASGGVSNLADIEALCVVEEEGISGAIIGRALYEGTLDFAVAQKWVRELAGGG